MPPDSWVCTTTGRSVAPVCHSQSVSEYVSARLRPEGSSTALARASSQGGGSPQENARTFQLPSYKVTSPSSAAVYSASPVRLHEQKTASGKRMESVLLLTHRRSL